MKKQSLLLVLFIIISCIALAQEGATNPSVGMTPNSTDSPTQNLSANGTDQQIEPNITLYELSNETSNETNDASPTEPVVEQVPSIVSFSLTNFTPREFEAGDVDMELTIKNTGTVPLQGLVPVIVGRGFFIYDVIPIAQLLPGESKVSEVLGHMSEKGTTILTIKINDQLFYQKVRVTGDVTEINQTLLDQIEQDRIKNKQTITEQLDELKDKTDELERTLELKANDYLLEGITTKDLLQYLQDTKYQLVADNVNLANVSVVLAQNEYDDLMHQLETAPKKSFWSKVNDNILIISTIGGALITIFTLYEIFQKKQDDIKKKLNEKKGEKEPEKKDPKKK